MFVALSRSRRSRMFCICATSSERLTNVAASCLIKGLKKSSGRKEKKALTMRKTKQRSQENKEKREERKAVIEHKKAAECAR